MAARDESADDTALRAQWAAAFGLQGRSDYRMFLRQLSLRSAGDGPEVCHELHYLQMACEKIAKAYRLQDTSVNIEGETSGHVAFSQFIESYLVSAGYGQRGRYQKKPHLFIGLRHRARHYAREIERLAPSVDREETPTNAEYPWQQGQEIKIPCQYSYPSLRFLTAPGPEGAEFLQILQAAIEQFAPTVP